MRPNPKRLSYMGALLVALASVSCNDPALVGLRGALEVEALSPSSLASSRSELTIEFGEAAAGLTERTAGFRLSDRGEAALVIGRLEWTEIAFGSEENPFTVALPQGRSLEPGQSVDVQVVLRIPLAHQLELPAELSATAVAHADGARPDASAVRITMKTKALPNPCSLPEELDFGVVAVGREESRTLQFFNPFSSSLHATALRISLPHADSGAFRFANGAGSFALPAEGIGELPIVFRPLTAKPYSGTAEFRAAPGCEPVKVRLKGEGTDKLLTANPARVDCGWLWPGQRVSKEITFKNHGLKPIRVFSVKAESEGPDTAPGEFELDENAWGGEPGFELGASESATREIVCAPVTTGQKRARLSFTSNAPGETSGSVALSMISGGPDLALEPERIDFGKVAYVATAGVPHSRRFAVRNLGWAPSGKVDGAVLHIGTLDEHGKRGPPWFRIEALNSTSRVSELIVEFGPSANPSSGILPPPYENTLEGEVRLTPSSAGAKQFRVTFSSNDPDEPNASWEIVAEAVELPECRYQLSATELDFGIVHSTAPKRLGVVFENLGTQPGEDCLVSEVELEPGSPPDYVVVEDPHGTIEVKPGERKALVVELQPKRLGSDDMRELTPGTLRMQVSSPGAPQPVVQLNGATGPGCMALIPGELDFGNVAPGKRSEPKTVRLINICAQTLTLHSVRLAPGSSTAFQLALTTPIVAPGLPVFEDNQKGTNQNGHVIPDTVPFSVAFEPSHLGPHWGAVELELSQGAGRIRHVVPLRGVGSASSLHSVVYEQEGGDPVDIVMVVAAWNGRTGESLRQGMGAQVPAFLSHLLKSGNDFQIGVLWANLDSLIDVRGFEVGANHPDRILRPSTPRLIEQLQAKVDYAYLDVFGKGGQSAWNQYHAWRSLVPPNSIGVNAGFLRSEARLALLFLLGAAGETHGLPAFPVVHSLTPPGDPGQYAVAFAGLKALEHPNPLSIGALVWMRPEPPFRDPRCLDGGSGVGWVFYQNVYKVLAAATRGTLEEACPEESEWPAIAESMAEVASGLRTRFALGQKPDFAKGPIEVKVDGIRVPATDAQGSPVWSYEPERNSVRFVLARTPMPGQKVEVTFHSVVP